MTPHPGMIHGDVFFDLVLSVVVSGSDVVDYRQSWGTGHKTSLGQGSWTSDVCAVATIVGRAILSEVLAATQDRSVSERGIQ